MSTAEYLTITLTLIIVIGLSTFLYFYYKHHKQGEDEANKFLDGLTDTIFTKLLDIIKSFNYDDYDDLVGIEVKIIGEMVDCAKEYIKEELSKSHDMISILAQKILTDEFIEKFVNKIIDTINLPETIELQLGDKFEKFNKEIVEEDKKLTEEYSDSKIYFKDEKDISEAKDLSIPNLEELIATNDVEIIQPREDEEEFNSEDSSMEIIPDSTTYVDSRGRIHDKATGKFIKLDLEVPEDTEEEE